MVRSDLIINLLTTVSLVTAQTNTYVALPSSAYDVKITNRPTPGPDEVVVQEDENGINIFAGTNRKAAIKKARDGCGDNLDAKCFQAVSEAWGYGHNGDEQGLSKRVIPFVLLAAPFVVAGISILISMWLLRDDAIHVPKVEEPFEPEPTTVYVVPDKPAITVVATPAPTAADAPELVVNNDKSVDITMTEDDAKHTIEAIEHIVCKRSVRLMSRQEMSDALRDCINLAAEDIALNTDIGRWLQKFQTLRVVNEIPLPADFPNVPQVLQDTIDLCTFAAKELKVQTARFVLLVAWSVLGAGLDFNGGKLHIGNDVLNKKFLGGDDEGVKTCKKPHKDGAYYCNQECCAKNPLVPGRRPKELTDLKVQLHEYNTLWSCKGCSNDDDRAGCDCYVARPRDPFFYDSLHLVDEAMEKIRGRETPVQTPVDTTPKWTKSCFKADKEKMADHHEWKWVEQPLLDENIKDFCSEQVWNDMGNGVKSRMYNDDKIEGESAEAEAVRRWNKVLIRVTEGAKREDCYDRLMEISAGCDHDEKMNQFNFKWGGRSVVENGPTWEIIPQNERVAFQTKGVVTCNKRMDSFESHGNKGRDGKVEINDEAKMALQMCIHQMRIHTIKNNEWLNFDCGGILPLGLNTNGGGGAKYGDPRNCAEVTWTCTSVNVEEGRSGRGFHHVGFVQCWTDLYY